MRRLLRAAGTCGSARHGKTAQIQSDEKRLAVDSVEPNIRSVGRPRRAGTVDVRARDAIENRLLEPITQRLQPSPLGDALIHDPLSGAPQCDCAGNVFSARSPV